jgi:hypothetical protein
MRVVGIDYASRGPSALALVVDGEPVKTKVYIPDHRKDESDAVMLSAYERWLLWHLKILKADVTIVEELAVFQNPKVIRALSHREGVALLCAKKRSPIVIHRTIVRARSVVFQNGNIGKDGAWDVRAKFIPFEFTKKKTVGGLDEMDAMTLALAAPVLLERA